MSHGTYINAAHTRMSHVISRPYVDTFPHCALHTPGEMLPSGAPEEEFGRMVFQKKSSLGDRTKFRSTTSAGAHGGAGTCDAPCILGRVLDSAFIQARVSLSCSDGLIYTGRHTFQCHASPPRTVSAQLQVRSPREDFF